MSEAPIYRAINMTVRCTKCGAVGINSCDCWEECKCGWTKERGGKCSNPQCKEPKKAPDHE